MENAQPIPLPAHIRFLSGPLPGKMYRITKPDLLIGSDQSCDIVVPDPTLAPQHVQLTWDDWQWHIKKLSPQNHLTVNTHEVLQGTIKHCDVISLSDNTAFVLLLEATNTTGPLGEGHGEENTRRPSPHEDTQRMSASDHHLEGTPHLKITDTDGSQRNFPLIKSSISIGRDRANDIVLKHETVSDYHLHIVKEGDQYICYHPHPIRGKTLNGIEHGTIYYHGNEQARIPLKHGTIIRIQSPNGRYISLSYDDGSGLLPRIDPAEFKPFPIPLNTPEITIGRALDNAVVLKDIRVSKHHARLERTEDGYQIVDLQSTNHTYVNSRPVSRYLLKPGDIVRIGRCEFIYTTTHLNPR